MNDMGDNSSYLFGLGNYLSSEAIPGALPTQQNSPQKPALGLYVEHFSGSAFTQPRKNNLKTWLYRIHPSVKQSEFTHVEKPLFLMNAPITTLCPPTQFRWNKLPIPTEPTDFIESLTTLMANGDVTSLSGSAIHIYRANKSMECYFYNADGDFLVVPQEGRLLIRTELGELTVEPLEIALIPRGMKFQIQLLDKVAYGYINENYGAPFELPELGPIGANGLANPRHFAVPVAQFEDLEGDFTLICKFEGEFWKAALSHSPFDVVAWHGNHVPYKYDLRRFNTIGSISFDHPDPSIFTVLTSPAIRPGMANVDFVIFPPRWLVAEDTFRPPWYHRNIMSEYMGLISGAYDAKANGFLPGGGSLHNRMAPHGPDGAVCETSMNKNLEPEHLTDTMAFMFESCMTWRATPFALEHAQDDYVACWSNIKKLYKK
jgi:homogentisate 1,2-dioxygenase